MSDWNQPVSRRFVDPKTGNIVVSETALDSLIRDSRITGAFDLPSTRRAFANELTQLFSVTWSDTLLGAFSTALSLHKAAHAPGGDSRSVTLASRDLPVSAPFEIQVTVNGAAVGTLNGAVKLVLDFSASLNVRDGCIEQVSPFRWRASPSVEVEDHEVWRADVTDHELLEPYVLQPPWRIARGGPASSPA